MKTDFNGFLATEKEACVQMYRCNIKTGLARNSQTLYGTLKSSVLLTGKAN